MSYWLEARVLAAVLYPLTFSVCESCLLPEKVIYSLIRSTSLLKEIFTSCPGGESEGKIPALEPHSQCERL